MVLLKFFAVNQPGQPLVFQANLNSGDWLPAPGDLAVWQGLPRPATVGKREFIYANVGGAQALTEVRCEVA